MANILMVLPYSGRKFGGGLAVFNAALTKALMEEGHDVRLLTMELPAPCAPGGEEHGNARILCIENEVTRQMRDPGGAAGEDERALLYKLINSKQVLLDPKVHALVREDGWSPQVIVGHSRFSGPAAIKLKQAWFPEAKAAYFVHSIPVEGSVLSGYEAYEERITSEVAERKFQKEKKWMPQADLVVAVGPLILAGVTMILQQANARVPVHECIGGVEMGADPVDFVPPYPTVKLLFLGRASAPIKGLEDLVLAALKLRVRNICIDVRYWDDRTYSAERTVRRADVQAWVDGVLGPMRDRNIRVNILDKTTEVSEEVRAHHALLMPSYIEHFGLVPFDALAHGVPVLVNEISGAGLFLGDERRFGQFGPPCVVRDFAPDKARPLRPADFLGDVARDAFDERPDAWARAIADLADHLEQRYKGARKILKVLKGYSWQDCARAFVTASLASRQVTVQGGGGEVIVRPGDTV